MRVLICPDKFAGTIGAADAARAIAAGWSSVRPGDELEIRPLADGGPGFLEVLSAAVPSRRVPVATTDPLGRPVAAEILLVGTTAYIESAQACGLHLLTRKERNPRITTSYGLGTLIAAAIITGATEIVVGLGGSATNDAGAGLLNRLGVVAVDANEVQLPPGGAALLRCAWIGAGDPLGAIRLVGATDVDSPLVGASGATAVFGPQKGATAADLKLLERALVHFGGVLGRDRGISDLASRPGGGAAGGLGAAIIALGGELTSGIGLVRKVTGLDAALDRADLVITGEGSLDEQSLRGKVVSDVAGVARDRGVPCVALAGVSTVSGAQARAAGVTEIRTLVEHFGSVDAAMSRPAEGLTALASSVAVGYKSDKRRIARLDSGETNDT
ncbi:MAG TPA: glycerate kinase [Micromonosporaceae bacterium]